MNTNDTELRAAIRKELARNGSGVEAVSFLHRSLCEDGWRGLGRLADFEATCRRLGFAVRPGVNRRNQKRTEVALPVARPVPAVGDAVRLNWDDGAAATGTVRAVELATGHVELTIEPNHEPGELYDYALGLDGRWYEVNDGQAPIDITVQ